MQKFEFDTTTEMLAGLNRMAEACEQAADNHRDSATARQFWLDAAAALYTAHLAIASRQREQRRQITGESL